MKTVSVNSRTSFDALKRYFMDVFQVLMQSNHINIRQQDFQGLTPFFFWFSKIFPTNMKKF